MIFNEVTTEAFIQAGAVGISIALIVLLVIITRANYRLIENHMQKSDDTIRENAKAMTKLAGVIESNTTAINRNTEITRRVERIMDGWK